MNKLTEDRTVEILAKYLKTNGWENISTCLGYKHGNDIEASKLNQKLIVEVKGAKAGTIKNREYFDKGQIKTHFGKVIVKILEEKSRNSGSKFAIAHPDDEYIRETIAHLIPYLKALGITHFWVSANETVIEE